MTDASDSEFDRVLPPGLKPSPRRTRERRSKLRVDAPEIVDRVLKFETDDRQRRTDDIEARIQRYAKYRMWTEGKDWPWPDASDISFPDMMTHSLRMQDTLHNAVMSQTPPLNARSLDNRDMGKQDTVDRLVEFQVFSEQDGEKVVGDIAESFVNDGVFTVFIPWIKERREVHDALIFDPIPGDLAPFEFFETLLRKQFSDGLATPIGEKDGWDWSVVSEDGETQKVSFFTRSDDRVEMVWERDVVVYDGPRLLPFPYEQVLYPARVENLQIPSPSNPRGAPHVILVDYPTKDEIVRKIKDKFYDLAGQEDIDQIMNVSRDTQNQETDTLKDDLRGQEATTDTNEDESQNRLTRLVCFDLFDIDGDDRGEDVIWWVIKETRTLLRARHLTEMYPSSPPRRPFAEATFLPVEGRREGIGLLEVIDGLHDAMKMIFDQSLDAGTIANAPFFFYRPHSTMKPEVIRMAPGEGYPMGDPSRDVSFPTIGNRDQTFGINVVTLLSQLEERLTTIGDIQLGRVPPGRSSALRTVGGLSLLQGQGEARPERILRRFFMGLRQIWIQIHSLNEHFLPDDKKIRVAGALRPGEDPYQNIADRSQIKGQFRFDFKANVLNTSKEALQGSLLELGRIYVNDLMLQMGMIDAGGIYRWARDTGRAFGQDPDAYIKPPSPEAVLPRIFAEEALQEIMQSGMPDGQPAEAGGWTEHLEKLGAFVQSDQFGLLERPVQVDIFRAYIQEVQERAVQEQRQQRELEAARNFNQSLGGGNQGGRPPENAPPSTENPPVQGGELLDETLPGAGGGGAQAQ